MDYEVREVNEGLSFGEICKVIWGRKILLVAITVAFALLATLTVTLIVNPLTTDYCLTFTVSWPNDDENKFPDGSDFAYLGVTSEENVRAVASRGEFDLDVDALAESGSMRIDAEIIVVGDQRRNTGKYTLTVASKFFANDLSATEFLKSLALTIKGKVTEMTDNIDFGVLLTGYESAKDYGSALDALWEQTGYVVSVYDGLISGLDARFRVDGKTLDGYRANALSAFSAGEYDRLMSDLAVGGFAQNEDEYYSYATSAFARIKSRIAQNDEVIARLSGNANLQSQFAEKLTDNALARSEASAITRGLLALARENGDVCGKSVTQIVGAYFDLTAEENTALKSLVENFDESAYQTYLAEKTDFISRLDEAFTAVNSATEKLEYVYAKAYDVSTLTVFAQNTAVKQGGVGIGLLLMIDVVGGVLVASIVVLIMDLPTYLKRKKEDLLKIKSNEGEHKGE